jgi:PAS domain S-box-containing protein
MKISTKTVLLAFATSVLMSLLLSGLFFWSKYEAHYEHELTVSQQSLEYDLLELRSSFDRLQWALEVVKDSGLAANFLSNGAKTRANDQPPQQTDASKRDAIYQLLHGLIANDSSFFQLRIIDLSGQELLRIDRQEAGFFVQPEEALQDKSRRNYMVQAQALETNERMYSAITLNQEQGVIELPERATLRGIVAIGGATGEKLGYFVVNKNMNSDLELLSLSKYAKDALIFDRSGRYLLHPDRLKTFANQRGNDASFQSDYPQIFQNLNAELGGLVGYWDDGASTAVYAGIGLEGESDASADTNYLFVLRFLDTQEIAGQALNSLIDVSWVALVIFLALGSVGFAVSFLIQRRFQVLDALVSYVREGNYGKAKSLVRDRADGDEVDNTGRAFIALVNEIKEAERLLEIEHEKISRVFNSITSAVIVTDSYGDIVESNEAALEIFGFSRDQLLGMNVKCLMPKEIAKEHDQYLENSRLEKKTTVLGERRDLLGVRSNGDFFPIELTLNGYKVGGKQNFVGIVTDLTEVRKTQSDLYLYAEKLRKSNEALQQFTYALSHDLKAPLRKIYSFSQLLESETLSEDGAYYLSRSLASAKRALEMFEAVMRLAMLDSLQENASPCNLDEIVDDAVQVVAESNSQIELRLERASLPTITGDRALLSQLFENLVQNSYKYGSVEGSLTLRIYKMNTVPEQAQEYFGSKECICVAFEDSGPGILEQDQVHLFKMFYRAANTSSIDGSGIGLSTCEKIMNLMSGTLFVDNSYTQGARFVLAFAI